ncbi:MAG: carboxypeptidase-like regulatory domain-containing protein [Candidatus Bathyarchaeota archaeon]|nr:carboxypeptidase-like regulatory domain-containing protein [Candidatus Bathyarchaeota archaeon]
MTSKEERELHKLNQTEAIAFIAILIMSIISLNLITHKVLAEVALEQITPTEGYVGTEVTLKGQVTTVNGSYEVLFDGTKVQEGNATLTEVSDIFIVPSSTSGLHGIVLRDVTNATESAAMNFTVKTNYIVNSLEPERPKQFQEGANVTLLGQISGGEPDRTSQLSIIVENPASVISSSPTFLIQTDSSGFGESSMIYPSDFNSGNQTTYLAGIYEISLVAQDETRATGNFTVGLTDKTEYHRFQTVNIQAANYTSMDDITIKVTHNDQKFFEQSSNASDGMVTANWTIPANASLGNYQVEVVKDPFEKKVPDIQNFTIVSKNFTSEIKALNLDQEPVKGILVEANNSTMNAVSSGFTNEEGIASINLEATNYTFAAFWSPSETPRAQVGKTQWISLGENLTGTQAPRINCTLAQIKINVKDEAGNNLPEIGLRANFTYTTRLGPPPHNDTLFTETDLAGYATFGNILTNTNYSIEASRYDYSFYNFETNLTSTSSFNITVPKYDLIIQTYARNGSILQDALVKVYEWGIGSRGLIATGDTEDTGQIALAATFGKYTLEVHKFDTIINTTTVLLVNQPTDFEIHCKLYSLSLNITVIDFFGQGIHNINVTLEREENTIASANTGEAGIAGFRELIGGNYRALLYAGKKPLGITTFRLEEPKTTTIRIAKVVSISGMLTETSHIITIIFFLVIIVISIVFFVYRRLKPASKEE